MACADDVTVLNLQLWLRVGNGAGLEHEVAVELVGISIRCCWKDESVTHPRGTRTLTVKSTFIDDTRFAVCLVVAHHRAMLSVIAWQHVVDAQHIKEALLTGVIRVTTR